MTSVQRYEAPVGLMRYGAELGREIAPLDPWDDWVRVFPQVVQFAEYVQHTDFVPADFKGKPDVIAAVVLAGREMRLGPMSSLRSLYPVKGRVGQTAEMMRAKALDAGHEIVIEELSDVRCIVKGRRRESTEWQRVTFTADQAKRMGISLTGDSSKGPGKYTPADKLYARATSRLCRYIFSDAIAGLPSVDELEDAELTGAGEGGNVNGSGSGTGRKMRRRTLATGTPPVTATNGEAPAAREETDESASGSVIEVPPTDIEDSADATVPPRVREQQLKALGGIFTKQLALKDVDDGRPYQDRHLLTSAIIGRLVDTWNDLTAEEAGNVISATGKAPRDETERREWVARGVAKGRVMVEARIAEDTAQVNEYLADAQEESINESASDGAHEADEIEDAEEVTDGERSAEAGESD